LVVIASKSCANVGEGESGAAVTEVKGRRVRAPRLVGLQDALPE
jgi:hypothetical protein